MKTRFYLPLALATLLGLASACGGEEKGNDVDTSLVAQPFVPMAPDSFNGDTAYAFVAKQLAFGPRIPNSAAHQKCAAWLASTLKGYGAEVTVQVADVKTHDGITFNNHNIIASYNPTAGHRIIVSSHWDSRPFADQDLNDDGKKKPVPGANDGASGVGVILELARQFSKHPPAIGVDLILWDSEDYGAYEVENSFCLGSQHWVKNRHVPGYKATWGINLDMVGAENANFTMEGYTMQSAPSYAQNVWSIAGKLGYARFFNWENDSPIIDDHYYLIQAGIPMVEVIDKRREQNGSGFYPHWHKTTDDMSQISATTLKAVGQTVFEVIMRER